MNTLATKMIQGWLLAAAMAVAPVAALAQNTPTVARAAMDTDLRAGPALEYPVVAILLTGTELLVQGCLPDYQWCDVTVNELRGWVYARNVLMPYQGQNAPVVQVAPLVGIAVMGFVLEDYWTSYYPTRPWYPQRHLWIRRVPPPPPPPPAPPHPRVGQPGVAPMPGVVNQPPARPPGGTASRPGRMPPGAQPGGQPGGHPGAQPGTQQGTQPVQRPPGQPSRDKRGTEGVSEGAPHGGPGNNRP